MLSVFGIIGDISAIILIQLDRCNSDLLKDILHKHRFDNSHCESIITGYLIMLSNIFFFIISSNLQYF